MDRRGPLADVVARGGAVRRATLFVRDMARSVAFYRGVFGLEIYANRVFNVVPGGAFPAGQAGRAGKGELTILKGRDPLVGMIGLLSYRDPPLAEPPVSERLGRGSVVLVMQVPSAAEAAAKVAGLGGAVVMAPQHGQNTGDLDGNRIPSEVFYARDPDGHFLEVFEAT